MGQIWQTPRTVPTHPSRFAPWHSFDPWLALKYWMGRHAPLTLKASPASAQRVPPPLRPGMHVTGSCAS
eukprot:2101506-Amphidinium_carterae.1